MTSLQTEGRGVGDCNNVHVARNDPPLLAIGGYGPEEGTENNSFN